MSFDIISGENVNLASRVYSIQVYEELKTGDKDEIA